MLSTRSSSNGPKHVGDSRRTCLFVAVVATGMVTMTAFAQQPQREFDRAFETAMERTAPDFHLQRRQDLREHGQREVFTSWTSDRAQVSLRYFVLESADTAAQLLQKRSSFLPIPTVRVEGFGDEAYLLAPSNPKGDRKIWFRHGAVVVEVTAPGEAGARRFARLFDDVLSRDLVPAAKRP